MRGCIDADEPAKYAERRSRADQAKTIWQGKVNKNLNKQVLNIIILINDICYFPFKKFQKTPRKSQRRRRLSTCGEET